MWAEVDLRLAAGAEAVAEVTTERGEVTWNLHAHPIPDSPATFVVLSRGAAGQASVRCAPDTPGFYSYLFENDRAAGPVRLRVSSSSTAMPVSRRSSRDRVAPELPRYSSRGSKNIGVKVWLRARARRCVPR